MNALVSIQLPPTMCRERGSCGAAAWRAPTLTAAATGHADVELSQAERRMALKGMRRVVLALVSAAGLVACVGMAQHVTRRQVPAGPGTDCGRISRSTSGWMSSWVA